MLFFRPSVPGLVGRGEAIFVEHRQRGVGVHQTGFASESLGGAHVSMQDLALVLDFHVVLMAILIVRRTGQTLGPGEPKTSVETDIFRCAQVGA